MTRTFKPGDRVAVLWPDKEHAGIYGSHALVERPTQGAGTMVTIFTTDAPSLPQGRSMLVNPDWLRRPVAYPDEHHVNESLDLGTRVVILNPHCPYGETAVVTDRKWFGAPAPGWRYVVATLDGEPVCVPGTHNRIHFPPRDLAWPREHEPRTETPTGRLKAMMG